MSIKSTIPLGMWTMDYHVFKDIDFKAKVHECNEVLHQPKTR